MGHLFLLFCIDNRLGAVLEGRKIIPVLGESSGGVSFKSQLFFCFPPVNIYKFCLPVLCLSTILLPCGLCWVWDFSFILFYFNLRSHIILVVTTSFSIVLSTFYIWKSYLLQLPFHVHIILVFPLAFGPFTAYFYWDGILVSFICMFYCLGLGS